MYLFVLFRGARRYTLLRKDDGSAPRAPGVIYTRAAAAAVIIILLCRVQYMAIICLYYIMTHAVGIRAAAIIETGRKRRARGVTGRPGRERNEFAGFDIKGGVALPANASAAAAIVVNPLRAHTSTATAEPPRRPPSPSTPPPPGGRAGPPAKLEYQSTSSHLDCRAVRSERQSSLARQLVATVVAVIAPGRRVASASLRVRSPQPSSSAERADDRRQCRVLINPARTRFTNVKTRLAARRRCHLHTYALYTRS